MLRSQLIKRVTARVLGQFPELQSNEHIKPATKAAVIYVFDEIIRALQHGEEAAIFEFGKFYPQLFAEKVIDRGLRNETYVVPQRLKVKFRSAESADRRLNKLAEVVRHLKKEMASIPERPSAGMPTPPPPRNKFP
jgi:nucleoid DNA-binding protein